MFDAASPDPFASTPTSSVWSLSTLPPQPAVRALATTTARLYRLHLVPDDGRGGSGGGGSLSKGDPAAWHCAMHEAFLNGLTQRWADTAMSEEERARPVLLFCHGFPESWFSWRHQMKAAHEAGYRGIAPYMRGYGEPRVEARPTAVAEFNCYRLCGDMLAILAHIGCTKAALVGHDHGAAFGWTAALLHPDVFPVYSAMSVPYFPRMPHAPLPIDGSMRSTYGDERAYDKSKPDSNPNFFYQLHHQLSSAEADYAEDTRAALMAMGFGNARGPGASAPLEASTKLFVEKDGQTTSPAMWKRAPQPAVLHDWISQPEFDYYVRDFEEHGWNGGLCWYVPTPT